MFDVQLCTMYESQRYDTGCVNTPGHNEGFFMFSDFYFLFNFQRQLTRVTVTVSAVKQMPLHDV